MATLTRSETAPYVEAIMLSTPPELSPVFAGQLRLEIPLITSFDVVMHADGDPTYLGPTFNSGCFSLDQEEQATRLTVYSGLITLEHELPLRVFVPNYASVGGAMLHATGPAEVLSALKRRARKRDMVLLRSGLFTPAGVQVDAGYERSIFQELGMPYMEPADRAVFGRIGSEQDVIEREVVSSKGDTVYLVRILGNKASCPCRGFNHRHQCRHLTQVREELGLPTPLRTDKLV